MRLARPLAIAAAALLIGSGCATGEVSPTGPAATASAAGPPTGSITTRTLAAGSPAAAPGSAAGRSIAATFAFGGPPGCAESNRCLVGLRALYGIVFGSFVPIDPAGSLTVDALRSGRVQAAILRGTDPAIGADGLAVLVDDRHLEPAGNLAPVMRTLALRLHGGVAALLDRVSARLTQDQLDALVRQVVLDGATPSDVARTWLEQTGFVPTGGSNEGTIVVGLAASPDQQVVAEIYAQELEANGYVVTRRSVAGASDVLVRAVEDGLIDLYPDELGSLSDALDGGAGRATIDPVATAAGLRQLLASLGVSLLAYAPAAVSQVVVVTGATARRLRLAAISDLARPAP